MSKVRSGDGLLTPCHSISGILESDLGDHSTTSLRKAAVFYKSCVDEGIIISTNYVQPFNDIYVFTCSILPPDSIEMEGLRPLATALKTYFSSWPMIEENWDEARFSFTTSLANLYVQGAVGTFWNQQSIFAVFVWPDRKLPGTPRLNVHFQRKLYNAEQELSCVVAHSSTPSRWTQANWGFLPPTTLIQS